ncbi:2,3-dihydro-2,3-dihydroxybenzoate dehydrogenase [Nocardiopsis halotolerans]|uniref:2,3-dihydro-2,3-dihydroxybenzoate dehydrogenase n=1 Tax=Nocardiopsis halotolerans TaxID=124252 RepID=UPI000477FFA9|nr:2,3-dihydro-2,3-dihydroxybenzoate dehydrogenase [Nocardiopsis halotolerans]
MSTTRSENPGVALVTGAAGGIGSAVVRALAGRGFSVAALDASGEAVRGLAADLADRGHRVVGHTVDVADEDSVEAAVASVEEEMGGVTAAVNVAGVLRWGAVTGFPSREWRELFDVNALGVFHVSRAAARVMVPRGAGSIVTVSSDAAAVPRAAMAAYAASKAAATHFTLCLGLELGSHGIRCNVVSPGSTDTAMRRRLWEGGPSSPEGSPGGDPSAFRPGVPLGRVARPEDVADAVTFLTSPNARHITLHDLRVDGGASLGA